MHHAQRSLKGSFTYRNAGRQIESDQTCEIIVFLPVRASLVNTSKEEEVVSLHATLTFWNATSVLFAAALGAGRCPSFSDGIFMCMRAWTRERDERSTYGKDLIFHKSGGIISRLRWCRLLWVHRRSGWGDLHEPKWQTWSGFDFVSSLSGKKYLVVCSPDAASWIHLMPDSIFIFNQQTSLGILPSLYCTSWLNLIELWSMIPRRPPPSICLVPVHSSGCFAESMAVLRKRGADRISRLSHAIFSAPPR